MPDNKILFDIRHFNAPSSFVTYIILFCLFTITSVAANSTEQDFPISQAQQQANDLQHFIRDTEINILTAGEQEFITLIKEQTTGFAKGIAFIVPEINQSIHHQAAISTLYGQLNDYGWTSMLLTMPSEMSPVFGAPEAKDNQSENSADSTAAQTKTEQAQDTDNITQTDGSEPLLDDGENKEQLADNPNLDIKSFHRPDYYSQKSSEKIGQLIAERMNAAWDLARQYPGFYLVICQGKSCNWLTNFFLQNQEVKPDAMVMLSAHMPQNNLNEMFAEQLSKTEFPVLDIYQSSDNPWVITNVKWRRKMARKNYKTDYRQRQLFSGIDYHGQQRRTIKEIYGFLTAVGM